MVIALPAMSLRTIPKFHGIGQHLNVHDFELPMLTRISGELNFLIQTFYV